MRWWNSYHLLIYCQRPLVADTDKAIKDVGHPERASFFLGLDPVCLRRTTSLANGGTVGNIDCIKPHQLDQSESSARALPTSPIICPHELVDGQQYPGLNLLNINAVQLIVFQIQSLEHSPSISVQGVADVLKLGRQGSGKCPHCILKTASMFAFGRLPSPRKVSTLVEDWCKYVHSVEKCLISALD
jgi:hypothetical protein